ncbi:hypothetical protein CL618_00220 [archaeon]|mgnify:CR=1 FL=1|nr:hypothetical protein [archaeon]|tara:strand:- start:186 stop:491 length:306 start_codon:yes stop_codon:yes gene_type:complete
MVNKKYLEGLKTGIGMLNHFIKRLEKKNPIKGGLVDATHTIESNTSVLKTGFQQERNNIKIKICDNILAEVAKIRQTKPYDTKKLRDISVRLTVLAGNLSS